MKFSTSVTLFAVALAATVSASSSDSKQQHRGLVRRIRSNNENVIENRGDEHVPHYVNLQKRYGGQATFYNNAVSEGACGGYTSPGDKIVALNIGQYGNPGAVSKWCGQKILITYGGKSEVATVVDCCPSCAYGSLDMSKGLFGAFADFGAGVFQMSWKPLSGGDDGSSDSGSDSGQKQKPSPRPSPKPSPTPKAKTTSTSSSSSKATSTSSSSSSSSTSSSSSSSSTEAAPSTTAPDSNLADLTNVYKGLLDMANAVGGH